MRGEPLSVEGHVAAITDETHNLQRLSGMLSGWGAWV